MICEKCGCDYAKSRAACPECGAPAPGYEKWASEGTWEPATPVPGPDEAPVLASWKTSVGWSVLGLLAGGYAWGIVSMVIAALLTAPVFLAIKASGSAIAAAAPVVVYTMLTSMFAVVVQSVVGIAYALFFYPSYFTARPRLKASGPIAFANCTFGGLIGLLWNSNLTKRIKGVSYAVVAALFAISLAMIVVAVPVTLNTANEDPVPFQLAFSRAYPDLVEAPDGYRTTESAPGLMFPPSGNSADEDVEAPFDMELEVFESAEDGVSFTVPWGWMEVDSPLGDDETVAYSPVGKPDVCMECSVADVWESLAAEERERLAREEVDNSLFSLEAIEEQTEMEDAVVDVVRIGGVNYIREAGFFADSASSGEVPCVCSLMHVENGVMYLFTYWDEDEYVNDYYDQFEEAVASAKFSTPEWVKE
ncbi:hypothetical protein [uncultured Adlercreutzia sp.]|uniref:hypothetical protein n=1 Tax=uncultured Adlercreutzia sp. TaxID=875803 RepID=UPI0026F3EE32|nr:hypothetical protein [uncultured Adlercreutzia sp.]